MIKKSKLIALLVLVSVMVTLGACGGSDSGGQAEDATAENTQAEEQAEEQTEEQTEEKAEEGEKTDMNNKETLVVYFSATGTTRGVAEKIAAVTGADIYEIKAAEEYTEADLDWHDKNSRTTHEQNDSSARPEIGSDLPSLEGYSTVYIGYPIWWGDEPRIMDTFVESCDFDGITMIPFCTSGGSGIGRSGKNLEENAGSGNWLDGERFSGSVSEDDLRAWIEGLEK